MEMQGDRKIHMGTNISDDLQEVSPELDLMDYLQKVQTKTEEETDQKESNELDNQADLQQLSDENEVETSDEELTCDNEIFDDVFTKMKAYDGKSKQEKIESNILNDEHQIFNDFFNVIEKHETNLTDENLSVVGRRLTLFLDATDNVDIDDLFTTDEVCAKKEIFYLYFDLINLPIIQNYLQNGSMPDQLEIPYRLSISRILDVMTKVSVCLDLGLSDVQHPTNSIKLLSLMLNHVKTDLESSDLTLEPSFTDVSVTRWYILAWIYEYARKTVLIPELIEAGCSEIMISALAITSKIEDVHSSLQEDILGIIYYISRHDDGVKRLNALNAVDLIKACQTDSELTVVNIDCCMILALLSTPEQIKKDGKHMNIILDILLEMVSCASVSSDYHSHDCDLSEPLIVFVKLFNNDRILDYIIEHSQVDLPTSSTVDFFINLLVKYHSEASDKDPAKQPACTALVNILWSISFHEKYKQNLKNAPIEFKELIQNMIQEADEETTLNQYIPQYIERKQKAGQGLLFNIDELIHPAIEQVLEASAVTANNPKPMIMISYSHADADFCKQLYEEILKKGYNIWIDFKFLKNGDLWETIAMGMIQASVIVCVMSENYYESKSCRLEATYALDKLQTTRTVIPVFLRKHELPGWLDIRTSVLKYVRFRDIKQIEDDKLFELLDMIENSLPADVPRTNLTSHPPILPTHHEPTSTPMTKTNEPTLQSSNISSAQAKSTMTKLENRDIASKSGPILRTPLAETLYPEKRTGEWDRSDISQWFQHNEIITELRDLCHFKDGSELLIYAKIFLDTEKLQYQMYSEEFLRSDGITFGERPLLLHEFTKFSNALQKLKKLERSA